MKTLLTVATFAAIVACFYILEANSVPVEDDSYDPEDPHVRVRRFTCDILGIEAWGIKLNDAACAANCRRQGRSGGYCNPQKVCICR